MHRATRPVAALAVATLAAGGLLVAPPAVAAPVAPVPPRPTAVGKNLDQRDRDLLAEATRRGRSTVTVLVAAGAGRGADAAARLRALGGRVISTDSAVDYVRAVLPVAAVPAASDAVDVDALDVADTVVVDDPTPTGTQAPVPQTPPSAATPRVNASLPVGEIRSPQYWTPTGAAAAGHDGRGTTVAIVDTGIDLAHPAFALTTTGARKVVDWYDALSADDGDGAHVEVAGSYTGPAFTTEWGTFTAPATGGPFQFGSFNEGDGDLGRSNTVVYADLNRNGVRFDRFGVLLDPATHTVWVDTDRDLSFADETPLTDYATRGDIGWFGTDDPATAVAERMAFTVQTGVPGEVVLGVAVTGHGSHVAGIAAGRGLFGGAMVGAAPGARLMSVRVCLADDSCPTTAIVDGVLYAAQHGADVVNVSLGSAAPLNDGRSAQGEIFRRVTAEYGVPVVVAAGNDGPGLNTVSVGGAADSVIAVGASVSKATWLANYGVQAVAAQGVFNFSARGPREDGGFGPSVVAPGSAVSAYPTWLPGAGVTDVLALPPGYAMINGTSMAAPQVTGAVAQLIGTWKKAHRGARPTPAAVRTALMSGARFLAGVPASAQGAGLVDVPAAAAVLAGSGTASAVTATVPVRTVLSAQLATPGRGTGIYDREGVVRGTAYTRTVSLTRTGGAATATRFEVSWRGNDGTFSAATGVVLPRGRTVSLPVTVTPVTTGLHSAILRVDDPATPGIDLQLPATVVVPFSGRSSYTETGTVTRAASTSRFVRVPVGTSALVVRLDASGAAGAGQVRFTRIDPTGTRRDGSSGRACWIPDTGSGCTTGTAAERTLVSPMPGVWEIAIEGNSASDADTAAWTLTVSVLGGDVAPASDRVTAAPGATVTTSATVTNRGPAYTGRLVGGPLLSVVPRTFTLSSYRSTSWYLDVPTGATTAGAAVVGVADTAADVDLYLYDCTRSSSCPLVNRSEGLGWSERVSAPVTTAGRFIVYVVAGAVPTGTTSMTVTDSWQSPDLGSVTATDTDSPRATGSTWTVPLQVQVGTADPGTAAGRVRTATTTVVTSTGATMPGNTITVVPPA